MSKRLENVRKTRPHTEYGIPPTKRPFKPYYNNEYSYGTRNLSRNRYGGGSSQNQLNSYVTTRTSKLTTTYVPFSHYVLPQTSSYYYNNKRFPQSITQQQLPKFKTNVFRNSNRIDKFKKYNVDIVRSVDITNEINENLQNSHFNKNAKDDFRTTATTTPPEVDVDDIRAGYVDEKRVEPSTNTNDFNDDVESEDIYYNNKPTTNRPEDEKTTTTTIAPNNNGYVSILLLLLRFIIAVDYYYFSCSLFYFLGRQSKQSERRK